MHTRLFRLMTGCNVCLGVCTSFPTAYCAIHTFTHFGIFSLSVYLSRFDVTVCFYAFFTNTNVACNTAAPYRICQSLTLLHARMVGAAREFKFKFLPSSLETYASEVRGYLTANTLPILCDAGNGLQTHTYAELIDIYPVPSQFSFTENRTTRLVLRSANESCVCETG